MSGNLTEIKTQLQSQVPSPMQQHALALLDEPGIELRVYRHAANAGLAALWRVRSKNEKLLKSSWGLPELADALQATSTQSHTQVHLVGSANLADLFFAEESGSFIGGIVVVMSEHTRKFRRGELLGRPFDSEPALAKTA